jgi:hypothetical protein
MEPEWDDIPDPDFFREDEATPEPEDAPGYEPVPGEEHWED